MNNNCEIKTIYITTEDFSVFDTTGTLTDVEIEKIKRDFTEEINQALNCKEYC